MHLRRAVHRPSDCAAEMSFKKQDGISKAGHDSVRHGCQNADSHEVTGIYDASRPIFELAPNSNTRGHSKKLIKKRSRLAVRSNFFSERVVSGWNSLPESVVSAPSVNAFKNRLDAHWATHPAIYNPECYN
ncbi:hypothetical protein RRG08_007057 [Elysia crispata]|uniref:Uncharacterized protein n=1 Tax=Elysia crispata TaxID=231223 RepID=A0AAE1DGW9_9GAST|nr:hypothetical protein RRG08_007057 [Elysia crispata]